MRVVDTSAWIESLADSPLGQRILGELPERVRCLVPTIVQLELARWLARNLSEGAADSMIAYTQECVVAPLDTSLALRAAELSSNRKLATADAIIYATTLAHDADLLTCDAHFEGLPHVLYFGKKPV